MDCQSPEGDAERAANPQVFQEQQERNGRDQGWSAVPNARRQIGVVQAHAQPRHSSARGRVARTGEKQVSSGEAGGEGSYGEKFESQSERESLEKGFYVRDIWSSGGDSGELLGPPIAESCSLSFGFSLDKGSKIIVFNEYLMISNHH